MAHEIDRVLRLAGTRELGIGIEEKSKMGARSNAGEQARIERRETVFQRKISEFIEEIAISDDDVRSAVASAGENDAQMHGVSQIEEMAHNGKIAGLHVLVATLHRMSWLSDALLTAKDFMHKAFTVAFSHDYIIPERDERVREALLGDHLTQRFDLRCLAGAVES